MNRNRALGAVGLGLLLGLGTRPADAGPVTWQFSGVTDEVSDRDNRLGGAISVGTPFSGSFTFESSTPDGRPDDPMLGSYDDAVTAISGQIGNHAFFGTDELHSAIGVADYPIGVDNDAFRIDIRSVSFPDFPG